MNRLEQKTTDALIARGFADTHAAGDCPEPGVLAALHERTLEADETQRWLPHVADGRRFRTVDGGARCGGHRCRDEAAEEHSRSVATEREIQDRE